jgi:hypothetical protein
MYKQCWLDRAQISANNACRREISRCEYTSAGPQDHWNEVKIWIASLPKSMAQTPVPVPISRTLCTPCFSSSIGARLSFPSNVRRNKWCWRSRRI